METVVSSKSRNSYIAAGSFSEPARVQKLFQLNAIGSCTPPRVKLRRPLCVKVGRKGG